ncbi:hypothetical protein J2Y69_001097 [Microbacterium resistens]|uniref:Uncharacterized protein n=1 Tax=Microbacterium resistens TaxID=156977 RepID=A0ABU1SA62_9MICO|nr:hypothetical protein [Microbacterium resistens]MDR6866504.1 hypothetical protein [Microbacterium resistens]
MNTQTTSVAPGIRRRTILKAAAWTAPAVAVAVAVPAASASTGNDVSFIEVGGDLEWAHSPDNTQWLETSAPHTIKLRATGAQPTPAGTTLTISFDNRYLGDPALSIAGLAVPAAAPVVSGNTTSVVFTIPAEIPVDGSDLVIDATWGTRDVVWVEDVVVPTLVLTPAATDPDTANNRSSPVARYITTYDAAVSATFVDYPLPGGSTWQVIETATVQALAPGDIAPSGVITLTVPDSAIADIRVASATIDGVARPGAVTLQSRSGSQVYFDVNEGIAAGSTLVVTFEHDLSPTPVTDFPGSSYARFQGDWVGDRDTSNDQSATTNP